MQCHHQTHLAEKRFFLSLYIEGEESFLDKRIFLGLLERNESPLIIKKTFKHPLELQQKFESQLFLIATSPFRQRRGGGIKEKARRRAIFAGLSSLTIFAAAVLNFRVRDGNGCDHRAIATRLFPWADAL